MPPRPSHQLRNVALLGHGGSGKTSLAEAMMFVSGATNRLGSVQAETSLLDHEPEEQKRKGSITTGFAWVDHEDHTVTLLDTPGDQSFLYDTLSALRGADAAVVVVSAADGLEVGTIRHYRAAADLGLPRAIFVNKLDRGVTDVDAVLAQIREVFGVRPVPLQVPIGTGDDFRGVVSLFQKKALLYELDGSGERTVAEVPKAMRDEVDAAWEVLVESVAETDEDLLEEYLENLELSASTVREGFRVALKDGKLLPIVFGAATQCIGAAALLDLATWAFPSPVERGPVVAMNGEDPVEVNLSEDGPFLAQVLHTTVDELAGKTSVFRILRGVPPGDGVVDSSGESGRERLGTLYRLRGRERTVVDTPVTGDIIGVSKLKGTHTTDTLSAPGDRTQLDRVGFPEPMMAYVIKPEGRGDADKLKTALERLQDEDPTLRVAADPLSHQLVLSGVGQLQLDMALARMVRKYKVAVTTELPLVPYRETLRSSVAQVEGKHKKQAGGAGQFGVAILNVSPLPRGGGFEFADHVKGGAIPNTLIPSVEKGIIERMKRGFLAGYPIVDIRVELTDGKYHPVDSKDVAFQMAGSKGLKAAFAAGGTVLLEPIMSVAVVVPNDAMGDVMGDLTSRRGRIAGMDTQGRTTTIHASVPQAEIRRYAPQLGSLTGGKGAFTTRLHGYEPVPPHLVDQVVAESPFIRHADD